MAEGAHWSLKQSAITADVHLSPNRPRLLLTRAKGATIVAITIRATNARVVISSRLPRIALCTRHSWGQVNLPTRQRDQLQAGIPADVALAPTENSRDGRLIYTDLSGDIGLASARRQETLDQRLPHELMLACIGCR